MSYRVEFADGPAQGIQQAPEPADRLYEFFEMPLDTEGNIHQGCGNFGGSANYRRRLVGGRLVFFLESIDRSEHKILELRQGFENHVLSQLIDKQYQSPDYSIYKVKPTDDHPQVLIVTGRRRAEVDEKIAPVIELLWKLNFDTIGSCQERPGTPEKPGRAYVGFWRAEDGIRVEKILNAASIECECVVKSREFKSKREDGSVSYSFNKDEANLRFLPADMERVIAALRAEVERQPSGG